MQKVRIMFGLTITFDYLILWSLLYDLLYSISFINEKLTAQQGILCVAYFGPLLSFRFGTCQHHRRNVLRLVPPQGQTRTLISVSKQVAYCLFQERRSDRRKWFLLFLQYLFAHIVQVRWLIHQSTSFPFRFTDLKKIFAIAYRHFTFSTVHECVYGLEVNIFTTKQNLISGWYGESIA